MIEKIKKRLFISLAAAGLIYLAFTIYADIGDVVSAFSRFNWLWLPLLLILSLLNYVTRFLKWDYYLGILKLKIKKIDSFAIFMSGLIMSVTPGKMGELLKAYLVKQISGTPVSKTAPIIFAERITDFLSLVLIAVLGAYAFEYGKTVVVIVGIFFILVVAVISYRKLAELIFSLLEKNNFFKKHLHSIHNAYESSYQMLKPVPLLKMTVLSFFSWFFECLGYYLILINFGIDVGLFWSSFSYSFATIVGAVSMLPGGLGVTEGSLTILLLEKGTSNEIAVASTFIVRVVTLWFAILVGVISVGFYQNRYGKITIESL